MTSNSEPASPAGDSDSEFSFNGDMFAEPEGFRPATPDPTQEEFARDPLCVQPGTPSSLRLEMMGERHSLWAHRIWNGGVALATYVDANKSIVKGKRVLELGCAAALPSMISAINEAEIVVATDYPDPNLIRTITKNLEENCPNQVAAGTLKLVPHQWGQEMQDVMGALPDASRKFDVIFQADLIFNHTEHRNLLKTCKAALEPKSGVMFVYFSSHVVKWEHKDLKFFEIAQETEFGFEVEEFDAVRATAMFPDDVGDINVRETVHCYRMWLKK
ncbi:nicotinamide n-methyltransferase [Podochytrium sp. JEL0797]|nr:nicotinamide n-methyltransferase [Podochytrium sp. JEL0797]